MKLRQILTSTLIVVITLMIYSGGVSAEHGKKKGHTKGKGHHKHSEQRPVSPPRAVVRTPDNGGSINGAPIMAHSCPFTCATLQINKSHCRDWREGTTCFVQDLNAKNVNYRIIANPSVDRRYYTIELPQTSAGQLIGEKIDGVIGNTLR